MIYQHLLLLNSNVFNMFYYAPCIIITPLAEAIKVTALYYFLHCGYIFLVNLWPSYFITFWIYRLSTANCQMSHEIPPPLKKFLNHLF